MRPRLGRRLAAMTLLLGLIGAVGPVAADDPGGGDGSGEDVGDAPDVEAPRPPTVEARVAVLVLGQDGEPLPSATRATLQVSMERALEGNGRLEVVDQDTELARRAGDVPSDAVSEARGLVIAGATLLRRGQAAPALAKLQAASAQLAEVLAWVQKQELAGAQFLLGAAHAIGGDAKAAVAEFVALLAWRPDFVADPEIAPTEVLPLWEKAQKKVGKLAGGSIEISSSPEGAMAYVDGRFVGFTPTVVEALPVATHYVTVRMFGRVRVVEAVKVSEKKASELRVRLEVTPGADRLNDAITEIAGGIGQRQASASVQAAFGDLAELLDVEHAVVLVAPDHGDTYQAYVYAVEGGTRLAMAEMTLGERDPEDAFAELARSLYHQISFEPPPPLPPRKKLKRPAAAGKPFYKTWWFWSGVGAAVAAGVALPLILGGGSGPEVGCPTGESCGVVVLSF